MAKAKQPFTYAEARLRCTKVLPYLTEHVMGMQVVERKGLGTFAVDNHMRLYYDPEFMSQCTLDEVAGIILHEDLHLVLKHPQRAQAIFKGRPTKFQQWCWNLAIDCVVNDMLGECKDRNDKPCVTLPKDRITSKSLGLKPNRAAEEYYYELLEKVQKWDGCDDPADGVEAPDGEGDWSEGRGQGEGSGEHGEGLPKPGQGSGGSCGDGLQRPWEEKAPDNSNPESTPGRTQHEQDMLNRKVAQAIEQYRKDKGDVPGSFQKLADSILKPKVDPCRELEAQVRYATNCAYGFGHHTWRKPNRRVPPGCGQLPTHVKPVPKVTVAIDTSGSMDAKDLGLAMGTVAKVIRGMPSKEGLHVIAGDTHAQAAANIFSINQVDMNGKGGKLSLCGGGGTDMGQVIVDASKQKPKPDVILCISDGYSNWPAQPVGCKVVLALTRTHKDYPPPSWMTVIQINPDESEE